MGRSEDPWRGERARMAASSVFSLAREDPMLRPESTEAIERVAAELSPRGGPIPRMVVEEAWGAKTRSSCSEFVFVDEASEQVVPLDLMKVWRRERGWGGGRVGRV
jgi:hypothetical protein